MRKTTFFAAILTLSALTALVAVPAATKADSNHEGVLKYRQLVMKAVGAHMGGIGAIPKGEVSYGPKHIEEHAESIAYMAELLPDAFRENVGTSGGETAAKQEIWGDWDNFVAKAKGLEAAAETLAEIAETGDMAAIGAGVKELGGACGACHTPFRVKK